MDDEYYFGARLFIAGLVVGMLTYGLLAWGYLLRTHRNWILNAPIPNDDSVLSPLPPMSYNDYVRSTLRLVRGLRVAGLIAAFTTGWVMLEVPNVYRAAAAGRTRHMPRTFNR
jgi:hypothetical protein